MAGNNPNAAAAPRCRKATTPISTIEREHAVARRGQRRNISFRSIPNGFHTPSPQRYTAASGYLEIGVRRREFLRLAGGVAASWPLAASRQQKAGPRQV